MVVIYDGLCNFCNGWVRFLANRTPRDVFLFAAAQSLPGESLLQSHGIDLGAPSETIILIEGDRHYVKSEAVIRMLLECGGPWRLTGLLRIVPRKLRDWVYSSFASRRYRLFGKSTTCQVPDASRRDRFLTEVLTANPRGKS